MGDARFVKLFTLLLFSFVLAASAEPSRAAGDDVPAWLRQAAAASVPTYDKDVPAVVVNDEESSTVNPDGSVKKYGNDETIDRIADSGNLYDEVRLKEINATHDAEVGAVFGYQSTTQNRPWFPQAEWWFQESLPALASRLTLTVPAGRRAAGTVYNASKVEPAVSGNSYTWEMRDLPRVEDEPADRYGQTMPDRLLVFKSALVARTGTAWLAERSRKHPVVLESKAFNETVRFKLPAGFDMDELPDAVKLDSEFGTYTASCEVKDGQLVFTRSLVQRAATVPVEKYTDVRNFFSRLRASEEAPVVLSKK